MLFAPYLPVQFSLIDESKSAQYFERYHSTLTQRTGRELHHVNRVIVTLQTCSLVLLVGVLPGLRNGTVVERELAVFDDPKLAILAVLLDRVVLLLRRDLHLCDSTLGNLVHKVVEDLVLNGKEHRLCQVGREGGREGGREVEEVKCRRSRSWFCPPSQDIPVY